MESDQVKVWWSWYFQSLVVDSCKLMAAQDFLRKCPVISWGFLTLFRVHGIVWRSSGHCAGRCVQVETPNTVTGMVGSKCSAHIRTCCLWCLSSCASRILLESSTEQCGKSLSVLKIRFSTKVFWTRKFNSNCKTLVSQHEFPTYFS